MTVVGAVVLWLLGDCIFTVFDPTASEASRFFAGRSLGDFLFFGGIFGTMMLVFGLSTAERRFDKQRRQFGGRGKLPPTAIFLWH